MSTDYTPGYRLGRSGNLEVLTITLDTTDERSHRLMESIKLAIVADERRDYLERAASQTFGKLDV